MTDIQCRKFTGVDYVIVAGVVLLSIGFAIIFLDMVFGPMIRPMDYAIYFQGIDNTVFAMFGVGVSEFTTRMFIYGAVLFFPALFVKWVRSLN